MRSHCRLTWHNWSHLFEQAHHPILAAAGPSTPVRPYTGFHIHSVHRRSCARLRIFLHRQTGGWLHDRRHESRHSLSGMVLQAKRKGVQIRRKRSADRGVLLWPRVSIQESVWFRLLQCLGVSQDGRQKRILLSPGDSVSCWDYRGQSVCDRELSFPRCGAKRSGVSRTASSSISVRSFLTIGVSCGVPGVLPDRRP